MVFLPGIGSSVWPLPMQVLTGLVELAWFGSIYRLARAWYEQQWLSTCQTTMLHCTRMGGNTRTISMQHFCARAFMECNSYHFTFTNKTMPCAIVDRLRTVELSNRGTQDLGFTCQPLCRTSSSCVSVHMHLPTQTEVIHSCIHEGACWRRIVLFHQVVALYCYSMRSWYPSMVDLPCEITTQQWLHTCSTNEYYEIFQVWSCRWPVQWPERSIY